MPHIKFKGKNLVVNHHLVVPYHTLVPRRNLSVIAKNQNVSLHDNLILHGDNLLALKSLLPTHSGKINCIYIDPPYNTGNENWCYNDNVKNPMTQEWLGKVVDKEDLTRHDKWLCMMYPRLNLLHELLAEDGVIFVSIDDNEVHRLRMLMDEIFGENNFVAKIIKQTKIGGGSDSRHIVKEHEYILTYAKNIEMLNPMFVKFTDDYLRRYKEEDKLGKYFWDTFARPGLKQPLKYTITAPDGTKITGDWTRSQSRFVKDLETGEIKFEQKTNGDWSVLFKQRLNLKGKKPRTLSKELGGTIEGKNEIREIFGDDRAFNYPKSFKTIKYIIESINNPNAVILDSFAGSGTTAHAVMQLNSEDGGNRKYILVECEEYANKITAERVRRVIKGVKNAKDDSLKEGLGGGFSYFELGEAVEIKRILEQKFLPSYKELARYVFFTATGEQWNEKGMKKKTNYIGESHHYEVYLLYTQEINKLKKIALTLDGADEIPLSKSGKVRLIFAPVRYINIDELNKRKMKFCQLPFEIYKMAKLQDQEPKGKGK